MSITRHHNEWLSLVPNSGPFLSLPVLAQAFPQGLDAHDADHARRLRLAFDEWDDNQLGNRPDPSIHRAWMKFVLGETLGYDELLAEGQAIPQTLNSEVAEYGDGDWDNRGHGGGGSLTFRWHSILDKYIGLDKGELGFRIAVADVAQQEAKWNEWSESLLAMKGAAEFTIKRSRLRLGKRMKVAVLIGDYRQKFEDGCIDLDRTVETLKKAEELMDSALLQLKSAIAFTT